MKVLLGVTGGIAAYKACSLVSYLVGKGHEVKVVMTPDATRFVGEITFQALSKNPVYVDMYDIKDPSKVEHIDLAGWADVVCVAPATANTLGKLANGICDNLLTTVLMAVPYNTPIVLAPAMNTHMWNNPIMQKNMNILRDLDSAPHAVHPDGNPPGLRKCYIVPPVSGVLACGDTGVGKLADNKDIVKAILEAYENN